MDTVHDDRRTAARHKVFGGNAEIQAVIGRGRKPKVRAKIVDWSRGGMRLRLPSPRRRFLVQKLEPALFEDDSVVCTLRLPPSYQGIYVSAEVVHAVRASDDPDQLEVGLRFDPTNTPPEKLAALRKLLEPKARSSSGRMARISDKSALISEELSSTDGGDTPRRASGRTRRASGRTRRASGRQRGES